MPRYIPLYQIEKALGDSFPSDLLSDAGVEQLKGAMQLAEHQSALQNFGISGTDLSTYLDSLSAQNLLFQRWIESNKVLADLLVSGVLKEYKDNQGLGEHRLFIAFQSYLSPFLCERLLSFTSLSTDTVLLEVSSFLPLLDGDHRFLIENQLFTAVRRQLEKINAEHLKWEREELIMSEVMPLVSDEIIQRLNASSKSSYANKLQYVDTLLKTLYAPGCTPRFANWLIKRLELLELNAEHQERITSFKRDLATGELKVRNAQFVKTKGAKRWIPTTIVLLLAGLVFYIVYFKPFNKPDEVDDIKRSSFTELTEQERREIDSIVQSMNAIVPENEDESDPGFFTGGNSILALRHAFQNQLMEQIYDDHVLDGRLAYMFTDSCSKSVKFQAYAACDELAKNKGTESVLRNESEYDLVLFVADAHVTGKVYSALVKKGDQLTFNLAKGQILTLVAGEKYNAFSAPSGASSDQLPSKAYSHHFCSRDANFEESINQSYVMNAGSTKGKFVMAGTKNQYLRFIDLSGVTNPY